MDRYTKASSLPAADAIVAISEVCGVSADWLLGLTDTRSGGSPATATNGSAAATGHARATVHHAPSADTARLEELLETQRRLISTQQRLLDALTKQKN